MDRSTACCQSEPRKPWDQRALPQGMKPIVFVEGQTDAEARQKLKRLLQDDDAVPVFNCEPCDVNLDELIDFLDANDAPPVAAIPG